MLLGVTGWGRRRSALAGAAREQAGVTKLLPVAQSWWYASVQAEPLSLPMRSVVAAPSPGCSPVAPTRRSPSAPPRDLYPTAPLPTCPPPLLQVQYPDALPTMTLDLSNIRLFAAYLSKTEIKFDLVRAGTITPQVLVWCATNP